MNSRATAALITGGLLAVGAMAWYLFPRPRPQKATAGSDYVDSKQCRACHSAIYASYQQVGMARAFAPVASASGIEDYGANNHFTHAASGRHYEAVRRGNQVFQRRFELDAAGRQIHVYELEATHAVGSGNHARTFLHRSAIGEFTELPLTWYSQEKRWALSPGFDQSSPPDFTRIVDDRCLFCHNAYPDANGNLAQGIDCQRCHGPGLRHIELAGSGKSGKQEITAAIVNPARLNPDRQLEVCMQCHLETTSSALPSMLRRVDREVHSFRPGEPLGDYGISFDEAPGTGRPEKFEIVNQVYRMRQSACFLKSGGRLTCTTCHNPHAVKHGETARAGYRAQCRTCHTTLSTAAHKDPEKADCIGCHMPSRRTEDAVHVVMTDHLIRRKPLTGDLTRERAEDHRPTHATPAIYYPPQLPQTDQDLYLGIALIENGAGRRRGIELLERQIRPETHPKAKAVLAQAYLAEGDAAKAAEIFRQSLAQDPNLTKARYNLAQALEASGQTKEAQEQYQQVLRTQPQFPEAEYALANLLRNTGDQSGAIEHYNAAIRLRPTYAEAYVNLGALTGESDKLEQALRINPALEDAHINLARVLVTQHKVAEALDHAQRAAAINPQNPVAQYNVARLLQETGRTRDAELAYRRAIAIRPSFVEAHLSLGQLLGDAGRIPDAITEFREVLHLQPGHIEAQRNLEMALSMK